MQQETKFNKRVADELDTYLHSWGLKTQELSRRGIPDHLWCIEGLFVALEGKMDAADEHKNAGRSVLQRYNLEKIRRAGGFASFISPKTFDKVFQQLEDFIESQNEKGGERENR